MQSGSVNSELLSAATTYEQGIFKTAEFCFLQVTDFGLAVQKVGGSETMFQSTCGTPIYMGKSSTSCDLFLINLIAWEKWCYNELSQFCNSQ